MTSEAAERAKALSTALAEMGTNTRKPGEAVTQAGATPAHPRDWLVSNARLLLDTNPAIEVVQQHLYTVSMEPDQHPGDVIRISDRAMNSLLNVGYVQLVKEKQRYIISFPRELYAKAQHISLAYPGNRVIVQARHRGTGRMDLVASGGREDEEIYEGPPPILPAKKFT